MRSQCNFQWTIKRRIPSNSRDWKKRRKIGSSFLHDLAEFSRSPSNLLQEQSGASRRSHSVVSFLHHRDSTAASRVGGDESSDLLGLTVVLLGLYCRIWTEALSERLLCHLGCPPPLCYTVLKTSGEGCFKTRAGILRHIAEMSGFQCYCCEEALPVRKVISPRCCHSWWRDCNLSERAMMSNSRLPLFGLCFIDIRLG